MQFLELQDLIQKKKKSENAVAWRGELEWKMVYNLSKKVYQIFHFITRLSSTKLSFY